MGEVSGGTVVKTPEGLKVPLFLYAVAIAVLISAGSAAAMYKINYPWWVWIVEALILLPIVYGISRKLTSVDNSGEYVIISRPKVILFSTISAVVIVMLIIVAVVL
jgi:hypothetical protein